MEAERDVGVVGDGAEELVVAARVVVVKHGGLGTNAKHQLGLPKVDQRCSTTQLESETHRLASRSLRADYGLISANDEGGRVDALVVDREATSSGGGLQREPVKMSECVSGVVEITELGNKHLKGFLKVTSVSLLLISAA